MRALRAQVPTCLACLRAQVSTCLARFRTHVPLYIVCLHAHLPRCLACVRAHVPTCLACSRANVSYVLTCQLPTCLRAIASNNKNKFSMTFFIRFEIKLYIKNARAGISLETSILRIQLYITAFSLTRRKPLTALYNKMVCVLVEAIFKLLINSGRWILDIFHLGYLINK